VRVGHARVDFEIGISFRVGPDVAANLSDSIVGGAHEGLDIKIVGAVYDFYDISSIAETNELRTRLLFREMVDAKELIITK
jgi:hypothetical protein